MSKNSISAFPCPHGLYYVINFFFSPFPEYLIIFFIVYKCPFLLSALLQEADKIFPGIFIDSSILLIYSLLSLLYIIRSPLVPSIQLYISKENPPSILSNLSLYYLHSSKLFNSLFFNGLNLANNFTINFKNNSYLNV